MTVKKTTEDFFQNALIYHQQDHNEKLGTVPAIYTRDQPITPPILVTPPLQRGAHCTPFFYASISLIHAILKDKSHIRDKTI